MKNYFKQVSSWQYISRALAMQQLV